MKTLAIDCATEACSAALFDDEQLIDGAWEEIGRGHAERLVPMIAALPQKGRADRIIVSLGPGSFTGVRIGLAAARALGLAWNAQVLGYQTLALVAAMARETAGVQHVTVSMTGGHGEWFVQNFAADGTAAGKCASLKPEAARAGDVPHLVAGSTAKAFADGTARTALSILPDARKALLLPQAALTTDLSPIYGRGPDARLPEERA